MDKPAGLADSSPRKTSITGWLGASKPAT